MVVSQVIGGPSNKPSMFRVSHSEKPLGEREGIKGNDLLVDMLGVAFVDFCGYMFVSVIDLEKAGPSGDWGRIRTYVAY